MLSLAPGMLRLELIGGYALRSDLVSGSMRLPGDETTHSGVTELRASISLDKRWRLAVGLPFVAVRLRGPEVPGGVTVVGLGDASLEGRLGLRPGDGAVSLGFGAGLTFPTGRSVGDPGIGSGTYAAQLGTGVVVPIASIDATFDAASWLGIGVSVEGRWVAGANPEGYRSGSSVLGGLSAHLRIPKSGLTLSAVGSLLWRAQDEDLVPPAVGESPPSGGAWLQVGPVLTFAPAWGRLRGAAVFASVLFSPWQQVVGEQLAEQVAVAVGLSYTFRVFTPPEKPHHHDAEEGAADGDGHDHGHEHDAAHGSGTAAGPAPGKGRSTPPDVADAVTDGSHFELSEVLVPGKVTILDFWAEWCAPCKYLDAALRDLAAADPDLAIRRINIVTPESPAGSVLEGASLPRVRVYDRSGERIAELGFDLPAIEDAIAAGHARAAAPPPSSAPAPSPHPHDEDE